MSKLRTFSEMKEAAVLLGQIAADSRLIKLNRGESLRKALAELCLRAKFQAAAIADMQGLLLASHNSPFRQDVLGVVATILGQAQSKAAVALERTDLTSISMEVSIDEKAVVRRFECGDTSYYLLVLCSSELDERGELELSLNLISSIIGSGGAGGSP